MITVTDVAGKAVMKVSGTELCGQQTVTLDLTTVAKGMYTIRVQSQGAQSFSKIVIR